MLFYISYLTSNLYSNYYIRLVNKSNEGNKGNKGIDPR